MFYGTRDGNKFFNLSQTLSRLSRGTVSTQYRLCHRGKYILTRSPLNKDFGESHYIGPLHPENPGVYAGPPTDGAKSWVENMPHDGWRDISQAYISAYKSGASTPTVTKDEIVYYYRLMPKDTTCSSDATGPPTGRDYVEDNVYAVTMLTTPGTLTITSGNKTPVQYSAPAGVKIWSAPMGIGSQTFKLDRNGATVLSGTGSQQIQNSCTIYNFNAFVGTVV